MRRVSGKPRRVTQRVRSINNLSLTPDALLLLLPAAVDAVAAEDSTSLPSPSLSSPSPHSAAAAEGTVLSISADYSNPSTVDYRLLTDADALPLLLPAHPLPEVAAADSEPVPHTVCNIR